MNFFTPVQLRILKTCWIPALLSMLLLMAIDKSAVKLTNTIAEGGAFARVVISGAILNLCMICWEGIIKKDVRQIAILALVITLASAVHFSLEMFLTDASVGIQALLMMINTFAIILVAVITRFYVNGMADKLVAALLAAIIFSIIPRSGIPLPAIPVGRFNLTPLQNDIMLGIIRVLATVCTFICYYVTIFLIEKSFKWQPFFLKLQSRLMVINKWEYLFIYVSIWFAYMGGIGELAYMLNTFFGGEPLPVFFTGVIILKMLLVILFMYASAELLKNIVIGRMLSTGEYNPWLVIVHYIPVWNIGAMIKMFIAADKPATVEERASLYQLVDRQNVQRTMIIAGITAAAYSIYRLLVEPIGLVLPVVGLIIVLYLAKIFALFKLHSGKSYLMLLIALNVVTIFFSRDEYLVLSLSFLYLYYYMMKELFYPELQTEDLFDLPEPETGDIVTHTA